MSHKSKQIVIDDPEYFLGCLNRVGHENAYTGRHRTMECLNRLLKQSNHYVIVYHFRMNDFNVEQLGFQMFKVDKCDLPTNTPRRDEVLNMEYIIMEGTQKDRVSLRSLMALFPNVHLVDWATWRTYEDSHH